MRATIYSHCFLRDIPRRRFVAALCLGFTTGCSKAQQGPGIQVRATPEYKAQLRRFEGIRGGELHVDATFDAYSTFLLNTDTGFALMGGPVAYSKGDAKISGYGGRAEGDLLPMPTSIRMILHPNEATLLDYVPGSLPEYDRPAMTDVTVPVASRIPDEALADTRAGGMLRLKLRIHPQTLLVGWDVVRRPGLEHFKPSPQFPYDHVYAPPVYTSVGGDFRERLVVTDNRGRRFITPGWYIDPATGRKVETDF